MPDVLPALATDAPASGDGAAAAACLQCATPLLGPYCHVCGQHESVADRLTFRSLWRDFRRRRLNLDRGLFRTLLDIVLRPGAVARAFVEGRRQTYTHPITLLFVVYAVYAVIYGLLEEPFGRMIEAQVQSQLPDGEIPPELELGMTVMKEAMRVFYTYGTYFSLFVVLPFGWAARWLLGDRGRTAAECSVLGAYIEASVVVPSMLLLTPLAILTQSQAIGSLGLVLYLGYAAWGGWQFFDRTWGSAALSVLAMILGLVVYFGLFFLLAGGYGVYVGFQSAHAAG